MSELPDCYKCKNFYVTWQPQQPYGCHAMKFKSQKLPSMVVFEASGEKCLQYEQKPTANDSTS